MQVRTLRLANAAMEPVLGGRDDQSRRRRGRRRVRLAAMEPVLGGRDDVLGAVPFMRRVGAAMEPVLGGRDDTHSRCPIHRRARCRNGARPWRTGRLGRGSGSGPARPQPQWSPSLADGTTAITAEILLNGVWPQWSPSLADGTTRRSRRPPCPRRSGPQWSPSLADGTTVTRLAVTVGDVRAAMEPVLGGRDDPPFFGGSDLPRLAAMEPVLGGRDDGRRGRPD